VATSFCSSSGLGTHREESTVAAWFGWQRAPTRWQFRWPVVDFHCPGSFIQEGEGVSHWLIEETLTKEGAHREWGSGGTGD
jgi:hypothetical protein